jgi:hypothetical protein
LKNPDFTSGIELKLAYGQCRISKISGGYNKGRGGKGRGQKGRGGGKGRRERKEGGEEGKAGRDGAWVTDDPLAPVSRDFGRLITK